MTDFRTIRERYDWTALVKAVSDAHLNIAEQYDDWVGLAKAMACASFLCRRVAADSAEIISPHPP